MKDKCRFSITVPCELEKDIKELKKAPNYYEKPYAELYRDILRTGVDVIKQASQNA